MSLNHFFLTISIMNLIIFDYIGFDTRLTPRHSNPFQFPIVRPPTSGNPWGFGWNIGWNPSFHPYPFTFRFPHSNMAIANISLGARIRFDKWENVSFSGVEAWEVTG